MLRFWYNVVSLAFAAAGLSKLWAFSPQRRLFARWGWSPEVMRIIGGLEFGGALLLADRKTRGLAGPALAATSIAVLAGEVEHGEEDLIPARVMMLFAALSAA